MKTSIVVTAEHSAPLYASEAQCLAATGEKESHNGNRWAVWLTRGEVVELLAHKFPDLHTAEEYALGIAKELAALSGKDEDGKANQRVVRVN